MRFRMLLVLPALLLAGLVPVATTGSADAATMRTWDRLAHCESGGRWHIATGNGYYGGLQFSGSHLARVRRQAVRRAAPPRLAHPAGPGRRAGASLAGLGRLAVMLAPRRAALTR